MGIRKAIRYLETELRNLNRAIDAAEEHLAAQAEQRGYRCKPERPAPRRLGFPMSMLTRPKRPAQSQWRSGI
jgi:hypothetical protein